MSSRFGMGGKSLYLTVALSALLTADYAAQKAAEAPKKPTYKKTRKERRADARMDAKETKRLAHEAAKEQACPECGMHEKHWIVDNNLLMNSEGGFWTCPKFYDEKTGQRKDGKLG